VKWNFSIQSFRKKKPKSVFRRSIADKLYAKSDFITLTTTSSQIPRSINCSRRTLRLPHTPLQFSSSQQRGSNHSPRLRPPLTMPHGMKHTLQEATTMHQPSSHGEQLNHATLTSALVSSSRQSAPGSTRVMPFGSSSKIIPASNSPIYTNRLPDSHQ
jgi:hypothetical protein